MELIEKTKGGFKHKLGNFITGFTRIFDGIICLITLGNYNSNLCFRWICYRKNKNFLLND